VGGLLVAKVLFLGQARGHDLLGEIREQLNVNNAKVTAGQHELREHVDEGLLKQNDLLHQQTTAIDGKIVTMTQYIEKWFGEIGTRLEWLDHNIANPERRLPLRAPSPHEGSERGR
jgi:hypothetical protein